MIEADSMVMADMRQIPEQFITRLGRNDPGPIRELNDADLMVLYHAARQQCHLTYQAMLQAIGVHQGELQTLAAACFEAERRAKSIRILT